jgi:hypothetical protein
MVETPRTPLEASALWAERRSASTVDMKENLYQNRSGLIEAWTAAAAQTKSKTRKVELIYYLTGDYVWRQNKRAVEGDFRALRPLSAFQPCFTFRIL